MVLTDGEKKLYEETKRKNAELFRILRKIYKETGIGKNIEKEDLSELEKIVSKSPELQKMLGDYSRLRPYLDKKQEENIRKLIASKMYDVLGGKNEKTYLDVEDISVYITKINLGPLKTPDRSFTETNYRGGVEQLLYLIEDENEASKVLARIYSRELERKKDPIEAREFLKTLKNGK